MMTSSRPILWALAGVLLTLGRSDAAPSLLLADGGQARVPIVISANCSEATKAAAAELAGYLKSMTGATFEIQTGDGSAGLVLGTLQEFPDPVLQEPLAIRNGYDGREAFAIQTDSKRVRLLGATELGASHAAFAFLEDLGCRWFFPAKAWEVVPQRPHLEVSENRTDRPRFLSRRIWYGYGPFPDDKQHPLGGSCQKDYDAWARHNRMAASMRINAGHAWQNVIAENKAVFAAHPEYLALVKGKRTGEQLCVSNPEVRRLAVEWALRFLEKNPTQECVSMECSDGDGQCECEACRKLGSISDRVFGLANEVARAVAQKWPTKRVGCLAYNQHCDPPTFDLEPNVCVQLTAGFIRGSHSFDELADLWAKKCRNLGFYEYYSVWLWDFDKLPGGKGANISAIQSGLQRYAKLGAISVDAESGNNWGVHGLGYTIANHLMWNPDANVEEIESDFLDKAFGPASAPMRRYYESVRPDHFPLISRGFMGERYRDIEEACRLAHDRPDVLTRLDQLKHYLRYNHLQWLLEHEKDKARQKQLTLDILTLAYRTRYEYMNHWNAIQTTFASQAAKKFEEPTWQRNDHSPKPWSGAAPVSAEETEQWFREGLEFYQPTPVTEVSYDYTHLAPAALTAPKPASLTHVYQRPERYALASRQGEPMALTVIPGVIAWYRDRPEARWTLTTPEGAPVTQGTLPLDGEPHALSLSVPKAGAYIFECNDSGAGWRLQIAAEQPAAWLPKRGKTVIPLGQMPELFFYVPKGTAQVQYYSKGAAHKVFGPNHQVLATVSADEDTVTVLVPAGADGQAWSLSPHEVSQLWFYNVPNCLAASPQALVVPKEVLPLDAKGT